MLYHVYEYRDAEMGYGYSSTVGIVEADDKTGAYEKTTGLEDQYWYSYGCEEVSLSEAVAIKQRIEWEIAVRTKALERIEV